LVYELLVPLSDAVEGFAAFRSITVRAICAALTAFLVCLYVGPGIIARLGHLRLREAIRSDSDRLNEIHEDKRGTPTMGGMLIVLATVVACVLFARLDLPIVVAALWTTTAMGVLGGIDDRTKLLGLPDPKNPGRKRNGMDAWPKIAGQVLIGSIAIGWIWLELSDAPGWATFRAFDLSVPVQFSVFGFEIPWLLAGALFVAAGVFVMVATSNAVNLTDGLDGLAAGCGTITILVLMVTAYLVGRTDMAAALGSPFVPGAGELSVFLAALAGATGGFLWWNCHPAKLFMGNTGSMALGGALAFCAVALRQEVVLLVAGLAFVWETLSVILQVWSYRTRGTRIFLCAPYHHHLQFLGWSETRVVMSFWIGSAFFGVTALGLAKVL